MPEVFYNATNWSRNRIQRGDTEEHDFRLCDNYDDKDNRQNQETERLAFHQFRVLEGMITVVADHQVCQNVNQQDDREA